MTGSPRGRVKGAGYGSWAPREGGVHWTKIPQEVLEERAMIWPCRNGCLSLEREEEVALPPC